VFPLSCPWGELMHSKINERLVDNEDFLETAVVEEFL